LVPFAIRAFEGSIHKAEDNRVLVSKKLFESIHPPARPCVHPLGRNFGSAVTYYRGIEEREREREREREKESEKNRGL